MKQLSIIILSYNTKDLLQACLTSIYSNLHDIDFEVIVADNASTDDSVLMVKTEFPKAVVIQHRENYGFAKGNNKVLDIAKGNYLLFLNSDTEFCDNSLKDAVDYLERHPQIASLGGKMKNPDGSLQRSYGKFYTLPAVFQMLFGGDRVETVLQSGSRSKRVDWVSGGCMLIRKNAFEQAQGFDENFFMYIEDMELCYRIYKNGHAIIFYPHFLVMHHGQGSSTRTFAILHIYKGLLYFYRKHKSQFAYRMLQLLLSGKAILSIIVGTIMRNTYLTTTYKKALHEVL